MSEQNNIQDLIRQGIELAREGKKTEARQLFEQALEIDDRNEKAWYWLASVVPTREERLFALGQVLQINPNNERAKQAMEQLEAKGGKLQQPEPEVIPGVTRRQLMLIGGGGAAVVLLLVAILLGVISNRGAADANATSVAQAAADAATRVVQEVTSAYETQVAIASPTASATSTPDRATLPPTFTPTPTETPPVTATPLPILSGVGGRVYGWGGEDPLQISFTAFGIFNVPGGNFTRLTNDRGRNVVTNGDASRIAYTRYFSATSDWNIELNNTGGNDAQQPLTGQAVLKGEMPTWCPNNNLIAFVGLPTNLQNVGGDLLSVSRQLFTFDLDTRTLTRLTDDRIDYSYPAFSPDCSRLAVIRNDSTSATPGPDLIVFSLVSRDQLNITNDLDRFNETQPRWSPDGTQLVYTGYAAGEANNHEIVIRPSNGGGAPLLLVPDPNDSNDLYPIFDPTGRFLVFASNRSGNYDMYIFNLTTNELGQLTSTLVDEFPGAWTN